MLVHVEVQMYQPAGSTDVTRQRVDSAVDGMTR